MSGRVFGEIPGYPEGSRFGARAELYDTGAGCDLSASRPQQLLTWLEPSVAARSRGDLGPTVDRPAAGVRPPRAGEHGVVRMERLPLDQMPKIMGLSTR